MAKPHKFAWNGVEIETSLSIEQIANMSQRAAQESTGDLWNGKQRVVATRSSDRQIEFRVNDFLISFNKLMVFFLDLEERAGRSFASTRIEWYLTTQQTVAGFVPVSPKKMVAHHTYMQFGRNLADQVRAADPTARVTVREGAETAPSTAPPTTPSGGESLSIIAPPPLPSTSLPLPPPPPPASPISPSQSRVPAMPQRPPTAAGRSMSPDPGSSDPARQLSDSSLGFARERQLPDDSEAGGLVTAVPGFSRPAEPAGPGVAESSLSGPLRYPVVDDVDDDDDLEATRRTSRGAPRLWKLVLPDSTTVTLDSSSVIGRNPVAPSFMPEALPVQLADHTQSVSKTHAALEVRDGLVWITDLHSTNGTALMNPTGERSECLPGQALPAGNAWRIAFGDFVVQLREG
ncbi:FHA domain-containing protein [Sinomonas sp. JGH33]|uniref:FHA domain-containing protein n=1 Tax=Sinomonas terricola TaxID=3110330 RepID=A0ABU5TAC0_9MICC|nr:FHA domain-containing protein [Sinomonas sp. JGH33]MEA5456401.1 FHA domain-containing protein [Sinomonas sp. JGH33]